MRDLKSQKPLWISETAASETKRSCDHESGRQLRILYLAESFFRSRVAAGNVIYLRRRPFVRFDANKFASRKPALRGTLASDGSRH